jgi:formate dehydrogenase maturation protein FdhE
VLATAIELKTLQRLDEWERRDGSLPRAVEQYRQLLRLQVEADDMITQPLLGLRQEAATSLLSSGRPLLGFDDLFVDWSLFRRLLADVSSLILSDSGIALQISSELEQMSSTALVNTVRKWFNGDEFHLDACGEGGLVLGPVIRATIKPFLSRHRSYSLHLIHHELWRRALCPICGGSPDFGFLNERGQRWLLCSRCDAEWLYQRMECPWCGNIDPGKLAYFPDDAGLYRLYVCEECRRYLKVVDVRRAKEEVLLPLERILSVDLDRQACLLGYTVDSRPLLVR